ncbi:hypothetical protein Angca_001553, partial [Angiostrongylus cantonensis]
MSENRSIGLMYEAKSVINSKRYLLEKKIRKDFEKHSNAVNEQKLEGLDAVTYT